MVFSPGLALGSCLWVVISRKLVGNYRPMQFACLDHKCCVSKNLVDTFTPSLLECVGSVLACPPIIVD